MPPKPPVFSQNPAVNPAVKIARKPRRYLWNREGVLIKSSLIADSKIMLPTKARAKDEDQIDMNF
jgi:hypothetical protein